MKRSLIILLPALLALASCGTTAQYASREQEYPDGIYYRPQPVVELLSEDDFREMAARKNASDTLKLGSKGTVQKDDDPYYSYYYSPFHSPFYGYYGYYSPYYGYYSPYWSYRGYYSWADPASCPALFC